MFLLCVPVTNNIKLFVKRALKELNQETLFSFTTLTVVIYVLHSTAHTPVRCHLLYQIQMASPDFKDNNQSSSYLYFHTPDPSINKIYSIPPLLHSFALNSTLFTALLFQYEDCDHPLCLVRIIMTFIKNVTRHNSH